MIRKRKLLLLAAFTILSFILTIIYLMRLLSDSESSPKITHELIHEKIRYHLANLPEFYKIKAITPDGVADNFIQHINSVQGNGKDSLEELWNEVNSWVTKTQLTNFTSSKIGNVLQALKHAKIIFADVDTRGTQLKLLLTLEVSFLKAFLHRVSHRKILG